MSALLLVDLGCNARFLANHDSYCRDSAIANLVPRTSLQPRSQGILGTKLCYCNISVLLLSPHSDNAYACDPRIKKFKDEEKERKLAEKKAKKEAARLAAEEKERVSFL